MTPCGQRHTLRNAATNTIVHSVKNCNTPLSAHNSFQSLEDEVRPFSYRGKHSPRGGQKDQAATEQQFVGEPRQTKLFTSFRKVIILNVRIYYFTYFSPSSHLTLVCFFPVSLSLLIQHFQQVLWVLKFLLSPGLDT